MTAIHDFGRNTGGARIDRGFYAIDPRGGLLLLPPSAPLKAGWRLATNLDLDAKEAAEDSRRAGLVVIADAPVLDPDADGVSEIDAIED